MPKITVEVTQQDISKGIERSSCGCPIALALLRSAPGYSFDVGSIAVYIGYSGRRISYSRGAVLPKKAKDFILKFDSNIRVEPFKFELDIP